jgi:hypothetical protein
LFLFNRYLYAFEKISNGENIDSRDDDDEDSKRRNVSQLQRVPQSYNHSQHIVSGKIFFFFCFFQQLQNAYQAEFRIL